MKQLIAFINEHGVQAKEINNKLFVLDEWTQNGKSYSKWIELNPTVTSIKNYLGY